MHLICRLRYLRNLPIASVSSSLFPAASPWHSDWMLWAGREGVASSEWNVCKASCVWLWHTASFSQWSREEKTLGWTYVVSMKHNVIPMPAPRLRTAWKAQWNKPKFEGDTEQVFWHLFVCCLLSHFSSSYWAFPPVIPLGGWPSSLLDSVWCKVQLAYERRQILWRSVV